MREKPRVFPALDTSGDWICAQHRLWEMRRDRLLTHVNEVLQINYDISHLSAVFECDKECENIAWGGKIFHTDRTFICPDSPYRVPS